MIICLVVVKQENGGFAILNKVEGPLYLSPIIKRNAFLLRDRWRISTEPDATVTISFR